MQRHATPPTRWLLMLLLVAGPLAGCTPKHDATGEVEAPQRRAVELRLLVVDDPPLAAAVHQVAGEWKARSGAALTISETTSAELVDGQAMPESPDAVIYPSVLLGTLAERDWILPLANDYAENHELAWSDVFELLQVAETRWRTLPMAVPLGSPVFTCYYRADLLEKFHRRPPKTWAEYHELAKFFARRDNLGDAAPPADAPWVGCAEPLAPLWAGRVLLARAAAYAKHRDHYSTLFDIETMKPLVAGAGFVRALEELVAASKLGPPEPQSLDPAAARDAVLAGRAALALSWPAHERSETAGPAAGQLPVGFAELPGAADVYNFAEQSWEARPSDENVHVTLLCAAGRLGSVCAQSANPSEAYQLLAWLSGKDFGGKIGFVSSASPATTLYRRSQLRAPLPWVDPGVNLESARQYAATVRDALARQASLFVPRIPGSPRYMTALDAAVDLALRGEMSASEALTQAAAEWTKITEELGVDAQRKAYRASLGLEP